MNFNQVLSFFFSLVDSKVELERVRVLGECVCLLIGICEVGMMGVGQILGAQSYQTENIAPLATQSGFFQRIIC